MLIRKNSSIEKLNYELLEQRSFFERDHLIFKTVTLSQTKKYLHSKKFKFKNIIKQIKIPLAFNYICL